MSEQRCERANKEVQCSLLEKVCEQGARMSEQRGE